MGRLVGRRHVAGASPDEVGVPEASEPFNFTRDVVEALAAEPIRAALRFVDADGVIDGRSFQDVAAAAGRWTALLRSRRLEPGDRILVLLGRTPTWHAVLLGALKAGFVAVPCPEGASTEDVALRLEQSGAQLLVVDRANGATVPELGEAFEVLVVEEVATELRGLSGLQPTHDTTVADPAFILYPTGPTSAAQAVVCTHGDTRLAQLEDEAVEEDDPVTGDDVIWRATNEGGTRAAVWNNLLEPWSVGAQIVLHDAGFDVRERFELIRRLRVTVLCQTPAEFTTMVDHALAEDVDLGDLRQAVSVGDRLEPHVAKAFLATFGLALREERERAWAELPAVTPDSPVDTLHDRVSMLTTPNGHHPGTVDVTPEPREPEAEAAAAEEERREAERVAEEERRAAAAARGAKKDARRARAAIRADERRRERSERVAAREARRAEAEADLAAAAAAKVAERERKRQEKAAAEQAREVEAERRRAEKHAEAEERAAAEAAEQRRRSEEGARETAQQRHREASEKPAETVFATAAAGHEEQDDDDAPNTALMDRLRAYTHHEDGARPGPRAQ